MDEVQLQAIVDDLTRLHQKIDSIEQLLLSISNILKLQHEETSR